MTKQKRILLLVSALALLLIVALIFAACDFSFSDGGTLSVKFDENQVIHEGDDLETVKSYLTVTYTDENGTSVQITDFTLSGTLQAGDCKLTVTYNGITTTVTVNVTSSGIEPCEHVFSGWQQTTAATCTTAGEEKRTCSLCGTEEKEPIEALGHDVVSHEAKAATCTEVGWKAYETCSRCNHTTYVEIPALGHALTHMDAQSSTCLVQGNVEHWHCTVCQKNFEDDDGKIELSNVVLPLAHTFGEWHNAVEATCTETGAKGHKDCSGCHKHFDETGKEIEDIIIPLAAHTPSAATLENVVGSTCQKEGSCEIVVYCSVCKAEVSRTPQSIPKVAHTFGEWHNEVAATCTKDGTKGYQHCSICQKNYDAEENVIENIAIPAQHVVVSHEAKAATCTEVGWEAYETCSRCDYTTYVEIPALGHTLTHAEAQSSTCTVQGNVEYWHCETCQNNFGDEKGESQLENVTLPLTHTFGEWHEEVAATCEQTGTKAHKDCTNCQKHFDENSNEIEDITIDKLEHVYGEWTTVTSATCTASGEEKRVCNSCPHYETRTIDALGHDPVAHEAKSATCVDIGWEAYETCSRCDYTTYVEIAALGHMLTHVDGQAATCTKTGIVEYWHCETCNKNFGDDKGKNELESVVAPKLSHNYVNDICTVCGKEYIVEATGLKYTLSSDETYYIVSGIGTETETKFAIPSEYNNKPVREIASSAFGNNDSIVHIVIPDSVTSIGSSAFYDCDSLATVVIPSSVTNISNSIFYGCGRLVIYCEVASKPNSWDSDWSDSHWYDDEGYRKSYPVVWNCNTNKRADDGSDFAVIDGIRYALKENKATINYVHKSVTSVTIPSTLKYNDTDYAVTVIGENAFYNCDSITSVTIPSGVTSIGQSAFRYCSSLASVIVSSNVTKIGEDAFYGCDSLAFIEYENAYYLGNQDNPYFALVKAKTQDITSCEINDNTCVVASCAFDNCSSLVSITIPNSVKYINERAFGQSSRIESVYITDIAAWCGITFEGSYANPFGYGEGYLYLNGEQVTDLVIPSTVTSISDYAFSGVNISSLRFEDNSTLKTIGEDAFINCSNFKSVYITDLAAWCGVDFSYLAVDGSDFGDFLLYDLYLNDELITDLVIPSTVTDMGWALSCCNIQSVTFEENSQLQSLGLEPFFGCWKLTSITIPASVTSIDNYYVFFYCKSLSNITVDERNTTYCSGGNCIIEISTKTLIRGCKNSVIPSDGSVTSIGPMAFCETNIVSVEIPSSVTSISMEAFLDCSKLTDVYIPSSVTFIGGSAFYGCDNLTITCEASSRPSGWEDSWNPSKRPVHWGRQTVDGITYLVQDGVACVYDARSDVVSVKIPASITTNDGEVFPVASIGGHAFSGCNSLTSIEIPSSVTSIGSYAFYGCSSLTSVVIPDSVTEIGGGAFSCCRSLEDMTIPFVGAKAGVTGSDTYQYPFGYIFGTNSYSGDVATLQYYYGSSTSNTTSARYYIPASLKSVTVTGGNILYGAFYNCDITNITIGDDVTSIGEYAFYKCSSLISIEIPSGVTSIGSYAFSSCSKLENITFGKNSKLETIGDFSFANCSSLASVMFGENSRLTSIGNGAFSGCDNLSAVYITDIAAWCKISFESVNANPLYYAHNLYLNGELVTDLKIPSTVTQIGDHAFYACKSLTSVTIPDSVASIGSYPFSGLRNYAVIYCESGSQPIDWDSYWNYSNCPVVWNCNNNEVADDGNIYAVIDGIRYALKDGVATVVRQLSNTASVIIPSSVKYNEISYRVTAIGSYAFADYSSLASVIVPNSVESIGLDSFYGCNDLAYNEFGNAYYLGNEFNPYFALITTTSKEVTACVIHENTVVVASIAFYNCDSLTSINIPSSVTFMNDRAFYQCSKLEQVHITDLTAWCKISFENANANPLSYAHDLYLNDELVTELEIPSMVTEIKDYVFCGCSSLTSVTIPVGLTSIGNGAFSGCDNLSAVYIMDLAAWCRISFETSSANPLSYAHNLYLNDELVTDMEIPEEITEIKSYSFFGSDVKSVTINANINEIQNKAFANCGNLVSLSVVDENEKFHSDGNCVIETAAKTLILGCQNSVIPSDGSVVAIGPCAFYNCSSLTSIVIPASVTSIGDRAFCNCNKLASITFADDSKLELIGESAFTYCGFVNVVLPDSVTSIGRWAFQGCEYLIRIKLSSSLESLPYGMFMYCIHLETIEIPRSVTSIGTAAFYNCSMLTSVVIPNSVTSIEALAFAWCSDLTIYCEASSLPEGWNSSWKDSDTPVVWNMVDGLCYTIENGAATVSYCAKHIESVTIPSYIMRDGVAYPVTAIGTSAFRDCSSLTSIEIPSSVTSIGNFAFDGCRSLTSIEIPASVTSIGSYAWGSCSGLTAVHITDIAAWCRISFKTSSANPLSYAHNLYLNDELVTDMEIPAGVMSIGSFAFYSCSLTSMEIPDSVTSIGPSAFEDSGLANITFKDNCQLETIGQGAFAFCLHLTSIEIPDSVTLIGSAAFADSGLANITFKDNCQLEVIGDTAFAGCVDLMSITISSSVTIIGPGAFCDCSSRLVIYCEVESKPSNWDNLWNVAYVDEETESYGMYPVIWQCETNSLGDDGKVYTVINGIRYALKDGEGTVHTVMQSATSLIIPSLVVYDSVNYAIASIGNDAFLGCSSLTSIVIPASVTSIGDYAFYYCSNLTTINFTGTEEQWNAISKGTDWDFNTGNYTIVYNYVAE